MSRLRRKLGEPAAIETIPSAGYRIIGPVLLT
jgi:DNA-binding winged helix-turn-helix (wHTH) protein